MLADLTTTPFGTEELLVYTVEPAQERYKHFQHNATLPRQMLENYAILFNPAPKRIVYFYNLVDFANLRNNNIEFMRGIAKILEENSFFSPNIPMLLVLHDPMDKICNNEKPAHYTHEMCVIKTLWFYSCHKIFPSKEESCGTSS